MITKKGVTPIIGTLILIMIGVALGVTIFIFIKNYNVNLQTGLSEQVSCRDYSFSAGDACYNNTMNASKEGIILKFDAINYSPNINLTGFRVSVYYEGSGTFKTAEFNALIPATQTGKATSGFIEGTNAIHEIDIFPRINVNNKDIICEDIKKVIAGTEIKSC
jgi:flagellin-like protein